MGDWDRKGHHAMKTARASRNIYSACGRIVQAHLTCSSGMARWHMRIKCRLLPCRAGMRPQAPPCLAWRTCLRCHCPWRAGSRQLAERRPRQMAAEEGQRTAAQQQACLRLARTLQQQQESACHLEASWACYQTRNETRPGPPRQSNRSRSQRRARKAVSRQAWRPHRTSCMPCSLCDNKCRQLKQQQRPRQSSCRLGSHLLAMADQRSQVNCAWSPALQSECLAFLHLQQSCRGCNVKTEREQVSEGRKRRKHNCIKSTKSAS